MRVFVTGGTGLVGGRLVPRLLQRGDEVVLLTRRPDAARARFPACAVVGGDPMQAGAWADAVADCDAVVHLAGENVFARRWNESVKKMLVDSRVQGTHNVAAALRKQPRRADGGPK